MKNIKYIIFVLVACLFIAGCGSSEGNGGATGPVNQINNSDFTIDIDTGDRGTYIDIAVYSDIVDYDYEGGYNHKFTFNGEDMSEHLTWSSPNWAEYFYPGTLNPGDEVDVSYELELFDSKGLTYSKVVTGTIMMAYLAAWILPEMPITIDSMIVFAWTMIASNQLQYVLASSYGWSYKDDYGIDEFTKVIDNDLREYTFPANCVDDLSSEYQFVDLFYSVETLNYYLDNDLAIINSSMGSVSNDLVGKDTPRPNRDIRRERMSMLVKMIADNE